jgi:predicted GNAT family N-acyltransferase
MSFYILHLSPGSDLTDAYFVRTKVFQIEQGIAPEDEFDELDATCEHLVAYDGGSPMGTARYHLQDDGSAKVQRVAVLASQRGKKIGQKLMREIEHVAWRQGAPMLVLDSQLSAAGFYEALGFAREGDVFDDVGIPHVKMALDLRTTAMNEKHNGPSPRQNYGVQF